MKYIITERQFNLINEELDLSSPFLRRRINSIEKIIQDEISKIHESGGSEFTNIIEFMNGGASMDGFMLRIKVADLDRKRNQDLRTVEPEFAELIEYAGPH